MQSRDNKSRSLEAFKIPAFLSLFIRLWQLRAGAPSEFSTFIGKRTKVNSPFLHSSSKVRFSMLIMLFFEKRYLCRSRLLTGSRLRVSKPIPLCPEAVQGGGIPYYMGGRVDVCAGVAEHSQKRFLKIINLIGAGRLQARRLCVGIYRHILLYSVC